MFSAHPAGNPGDELGEQPLPADGSIDLTPIIRDYASLDIPIRQVCAEDCKGLCPVCGMNRNQEDCGHRQVSIDPRMAELQKLLENKETADSIVPSVNLTDAVSYKETASCLFVYKFIVRGSSGLSTVFHSCSS